ncbi:hydrolase [Ornithobacterium rhinotracheale]|uniref:hydrolase n=1 Tax=Ornithobacterium rhinotracheale TaxID=28251 RepID=UPI001FF46BB3|nr:hydrolase [Ornithobacterium rhinotracheale]MCK0203793.1 hydrolase [Ornithobacterium rhinotracheale]
MIIAIDFDGTIAVSKFPEILGLQFKVKKYIQKLKDDGHYIIIYTCRNGDNLTNAINFLLENGIPFDRINDNSPENLRQYNSANTRKVYADVYVDDKQVGGLPLWSEIYQFIKQKSNELNHTTTTQAAANDL